MTVSVITSSIGRKELRQCVESVKAQTYPCKHYVFVNGPKFHESARETLKDYPEVHAFYLPEETGDCGLGPSMAGVFGAAPFLTNADWIFYLNDDDFYDECHVSRIMAHTKANGLKWAYSLRKFVTIDGEFICNDDWCSLGYWSSLGQPNQYVVDNSCFAVSRELATKYALAWSALPFVGDRCFLAALKSSGAKYGSFGLYTTNYRIGTGSADGDPKLYLEAAAAAQKACPWGFPWARPWVSSP